MDVDIEKEKEFDFRKYQKLREQSFSYQFDYKVPKGTVIEEYYYMDENGIMSIQIKSKYGEDLRKTLTDLNSESVKLFDDSDLLLNDLFSWNRKTH